MAPIQREIVSVLKAANAEVSVSDLVDRVVVRQAATPSEVKAALLPMISAERIELTANRKLRLPIA
jgi:hypothetical protein